MGGVPGPGGPGPGGSGSGGVWWRPPPPDGYCCGRYASYWNSFLFCLNFSEGVVAPALCSAIRQRSHDQITISVRCQSQCSKSKGTYCSDSTSYFVQRLFLRRLFNTSFIAHGGNTDHTWRTTVHGDHYIIAIFQELG